jgi:hypothetical protein
MMQFVAWALAGVCAIVWLGWLAKGRASGRTKRLLFRATLVFAVALVVRLGLDVVPRHRASADVSLLIAAPLLLAYLYLVRFCPQCGLMERNLKPALCSRCGTALPRHGMTSVARRTGREERRQGRFFGRSGNGSG